MCCVQPKPALPALRILQIMVLTVLLLLPYPAACALPASAPSAPCRLPPRPPSSWTPCSRASTSPPASPAPASRSCAWTCSASAWTPWRSACATPRWTRARWVGCRGDGLQMNVVVPWAVMHGFGVRPGTRILKSSEECCAINAVLHTRYTTNQRVARTCPNQQRTSTGCPY